MIPAIGLTITSIFLTFVYTKLKNKYREENNYSQTYTDYINKLKENETKEKLTCDNREQYKEYITNLVDTLGRVKLLDKGVYALLDTAFICRVQKPLILNYLHDMGIEYQDWGSDGLVKAIYDLKVMKSNTNIMYLADEIKPKIREILTLLSKDSGAQYKDVVTINEFIKNLAEAHRLHTLKCEDEQGKKVIRA